MSNQETDERPTTLPRLQVKNDTQIQTLFSVFFYKYKSHRLSKVAQGNLQQQQQQQQQRQSTDQPAAAAKNRRPEGRSIFSTNITKQQQ